MRPKPRQVIFLNTIEYWEEPTNLKNDKQSEAMALSFGQAIEGQQNCAPDSSPEQLAKVKSKLLERKWPTNPISQNSP